MKFTQTQQQRIIELDLTGEYVPEAKEREFTSVEKREEFFQKVEQKLIAINQERLMDFVKQRGRSSLRRTETSLVELLNQLDFTEVTTPIKLAQGHLKKMGIEQEDPLWKQVYWIDEGKYCLRPMLAPNLYYLLGYFANSLDKPIRIFEIGPCFRKESKGSKHLSEFTMLNLVELGPTTEDLTARLESLIEQIMSLLELDYELEEEESTVYNKTIDVLVDGVEVGSAAIGPHTLDRAWNISDPWVGVGFGVERLVMCKEEFNNIKRIGRSLIYQDGARLNI
ncbi:pyrrolysine--tRNA(Pyl) ligase large subunit [Natroniella sulfidigena]|uniref:pyrrolysine--tRNA(Pyl) ligase large subunit n=1 Tax=Natroniella sulfidigena TaxID=723921 RepID=UPI00200AC90D|nr:pyrrolysine--tRNA(Pyl) ligase large subunit [Natroniella sulfidigena]MCK8817946.1 pyrrolysine--tRNA(Pyl) ligase large subunit [Natroniella sulfidigena]